MISIKPKWVAKILNEEKTIELRKTMPKCDLPIDVYIYCTKEEFPDITLYSQENEFGGYMEHTGNGKVVAKFTLNKIDEHHILPTERILPFNWNVEQKLKDLCLTKEEVMAYGKGQDYQAFLWHISNLVIFDKPKELSEFNSFQRAKATDCGFLKQCKNCGRRFNRCHLLKPLTKAPQSWCYVEEELR